MNILSAVYIPYDLICFIYESMNSPNANESF